MRKQPKNIDVLYLVKGREKLIKEVLNFQKGSYLISDKWNPETIDTTMPNLVVSIGESSYEIYNCYSRAKELGIATLTIIDGIPEWRDIWENPRYGIGGKFLNRQLFEADKVACHGKFMAWLFQRWGMTTKCEIVGMPWLDKYLDFKKNPAKEESPKNLVIMTANTPGFTLEQINKVELSLQDLNEVLKEMNNWNPIWRLRGGLEEKLGLKTEHYSKFELFDLLKIADAVITTPSTTIIESMLAKIPTAVLDYTNSPSYVMSPWKICHSSQIKFVLEELLNPPQNKMLYQDDMLHCYLECDTPSTPRLLKLMNEMSEIARKAREIGQKPNFDKLILNSDNYPITLPSNVFELKRLYPNHPVFSNIDLYSLQNEMVSLKEEVFYLRDRIKKRSIGYWLEKLATKLKKSFH